MRSFPQSPQTQHFSKNAYATNFQVSSYDRTIILTGLINSKSPKTHSISYEHYLDFFFLHYLYLFIFPYFA